LSGGPVIIIEHSAEAVSASNRSAMIDETGVRENEQVADALMISLAVIVLDELSNGCPRRLLSG
jgi:hypothetical protein